MRRAVHVVLAVGIAATALFVLLPRATGTTWHVVTTTWQQLSWWQLGLLSLLWFAGLVAHTWVLTGAMPGLRRDRALTLNLTGSAVANVAPFGGGLGVALNVLMLRRWGFTTHQASLFTVLSNACNVFTKALLPLVAVAVLLLDRSAVDPRLLVGGLIGAGTLLLLLGLAVATLGTETGSRAAAGVVTAVRDVPRVRVEARLAEIRATTGNAVRAGWRSMAFGTTAYSALGALLLWCCLHAVGAHVGMVAVLVLFAVERGLTAIPLTPGGAGVADVVTTAIAVHLVGGTAEHQALTAGILLYRAFTFGAEIPVGGAWLFGWLLASRRRRAGEAPAPSRDAELVRAA